MNSYITEVAESVSTPMHHAHSRSIDHASTHTYIHTYIQAGKSWDRIRKGEKERDGGGVRCWALWSLLHFCLSFSRMREQTMKDWRDMLIRLACQPFTPLQSCDRYMCLPRGAHNLFCTVLQGKFTVIVPRCPIMPYRTRTGRRRGPQLSYG